MKKLFTSLLVLLCAYSYAVVCTTCGSVTFKENKGQWDSRVLYKSEVKNAAIFFERQGITFHMVDGRDILRIKGDHHRMENYKVTIDYTLHLHAFKMKFLDALQPKVSGADTIGEYYSYFLGNDKSKWASKVRAVKQLNYAALYKGISLQVLSQDNKLKYLYEVEAGTATDVLRVSIEGAEASITTAGNLLIETSVGEVTDTKPYAYQLVNGSEVVVPCEFVLNGNILTYRFPQGYNHSQKLYIDPTLIFSTYSGSTADNFGYSATYDSKGNGFAAGSVFGIGYPVTLGAFQVQYVGGPGAAGLAGDDIGITKYNSDGTARLYSTYLGGNGQELPHSIFASSKDELYMLGTTSCFDFPVTLNAYDTTFNGGPDPGVFTGIGAHYVNGSDIVVCRLSADGTQLLASTYVGGTDNDGLNYTPGQAYSAPGFLRHNYADEVRGEIEIDKNDNIYIASTTHSTDFPRSPGTFQNTFGGRMDACIFKMDASLSTMIWSTTFGGTNDDAAYSVSIDQAENLFVAGGTRSGNFPVSGGAIQETYGGGKADGFVTHIDKNGQIMIASTYFGHVEYDQVYFVDLDRANNVYVFGQADNSDNFFIKNAVYNKPDGGQFISKFNNSLDTILWSTSFGRGLGVTDISPTAFLVDVCSNIYACGWGSQRVNNNVGGTGGTNGLDITTGAIKSTTTGEDFYLMVMRDDASALAYATFVGGDISEEHVDGGTSRFDRKGIVYQSVCAGCGSNDDFPTTPGAVSRTNNSSNCNNAIFKFDLDLPIVVADFDAQNGCKGVAVAFENKSKAAQSPTYQWLFGDGGNSTTPNPSHIYTQGGVYQVTLIAKDNGSCNGTDTITKQILIIGNAGTNILPAITVCQAQSTQIGIPPNSDSGVVYTWTPNDHLSSTTVSNPIANPEQTTTYRLLVSNGICVDTLFQTVVVFSDVLRLEGNDALCGGDTLQLSVTSTQPNQQLRYTWEPASQIISGANTATPLVSPSQPTTFTVTVINQINCVFTDSIRINVFSSLPDLNVVANPDTILLGDTTQLNVLFNQDVVSYTWRADTTLSATNIANPLAYPRQTQKYYVEVVDSRGCRKTDSVIVYVLNRPCKQVTIYIPNAFSPNDDGKNDKLYVRGYGIDQFVFSVYDRWGQKVFETRDITKPWDGTYKGKRLDPSVFGYYLEGNCEGGEKFFKKGNITLLR